MKAQPYNMEAMAKIVEGEISASFLSIESIMFL